MVVDLSLQTSPCCFFSARKLLAAPPRHRPFMHHNSSHVPKMITNESEVSRIPTAKLPPAPVYTPFFKSSRGKLVRRVLFVSVSIPPCRAALVPPHNMTQHPAPSPFSKVSRAARVAASNTSSTPSPLKLEHSRYFRAPISCAACSPCRSVTNLRLFLRISSMATGSSRRSFFRPTRMMGTPGHRSVASSIHYLSPCQLGVLIPLQDLIVLFKF